MSTLRKCTRCQKCLELDLFGKDKSRADGMAARCKPCNRLHVKGIPKYKRKNRDPLVVPPRQINLMKGRYVPPTGEYYRNDGNKHIKSVGF